MGTKTNNSLAPLKTLRGIFEEPKMQHRRDFLRENKLSLRELQKNTCDKLTQQKHDSDHRLNKHLQKFHKLKEPDITRAAVSQSRNNEQNSKRQSRASIVNDGGGDADGRINGKSGNVRRSFSQQRLRVESLHTDTDSIKQIQPNRQRSEIQFSNFAPRSASSVSIISKTDSCDKEIQTEDIYDEDFLHEALKKCSSIDVKSLAKQKSTDELRSRDNNYQYGHTSNDAQQYESNSNSKQSNERPAYGSQYRGEDNKSQSLHSPRSLNSYTFNDHNNKQENELQNNINEDIDQEFRNLKIAPDIKREEEPQLSARSRNSMCSSSTKRSVHTLGSRADLNLPRYLEKEKREKEEERLRELNKDTNCPLDHYALSEEDRLKTLQNTKQKMATLVSELNHMPMTMETLRVRTRKGQIEKELLKLEFDVRLYSKPKVYIPKTTTTNQN